MSETVSGVVKWFDSKKGYGFVKRDGHPDVFVHKTDVVGDAELVEGEAVEFVPAKGPKGLKATQVRVV